MATKKKENPTGTIYKAFGWKKAVKEKLSKTKKKAAPAKKKAPPKKKTAPKKASAKVLQGQKRKRVKVKDLVKTPRKKWI